MTQWHCRRAWVGGGVAADVLVAVSEEGTIDSVTAGESPSAGATRLEGLVFPGFVNAHSHLFHRLVRGHVESGPGDFWSWRQAMYDAASQLEPDSYRDIAIAAYREMVAAGYTSVVEFHYLHHRPDGSAYDDPNVMADAVADAAAEVGIGLTLLDTCYLSSGFGAPPEGVQRRFADPTADAWADRVSSWRPPEGVVLGAAIHSVRAVDPRSMETVSAWAGDRPLHVHLSEQPAENEACLAVYQRTPTQVLSDAGVLGPSATAVHATHVGRADIELLAGSGTAVVVCPSTERWLADGIGPTADLAAAGIPLSIGSDSQAVIDPFEEMRLLELHQRLLTGTTGSHSVADLVEAGTGWRGFRPGMAADLVEVKLDTPRTAGVPEEGVVFSATAADVATVVASGRRHQPPDTTASAASSRPSVWRESR